MTEHILTLRELNRATLARQLLLERVSLSPLDALKQLAGLQGQLPNPPYIGLWSRLESFQHVDLTQLIQQRQVVRTTMMRSTLHLMTAEDYMHIWHALQPIHTRHLNAYYSKQARSLDKERLLAEIRAYIQEQPRTNVHLRRKLAELVPAHDMDEIMIYRVRAYLPLIQVFPGGTWNVGGSPAYTEASAWLGRAFTPPAESLRHLILSYLAAFGPASVKDIQAWSGLTRLQGAVDALRAELVTFRDEQGRELFDVPGAPLPSADTPVQVRFIPEFDNLVLAHDDRRRMIADEYRPIVFPGLSVVRATILVDGFVRGTWKIERKTAMAKLIIEPFEPFSDQVRDELQAEGERLMGWMLDGAETFEIEYTNK